MNPIQITTEVWAESGGPILKEALRLEARTWHQIHQPPSRLQDWLKARRKLRRDLLDAAGSFPPAPDLQLREHGSIGQKGYRITKVTYQSRPGLRVTALLFRPAGPGPFPAVLNMHGHLGAGKNRFGCCPALPDSCQGRICRLERRCHRRRRKGDSPRRI